MTRADNKLTLVNIKISKGACENLSKHEFNSLSDTARDFFFFYFIQSFGNKFKVRDFINIWLLEDED